jgi:magnesium-transporting ATPase (P-type)
MHRSCNLLLQHACEYTSASCSLSSDKLISQFTTVLTALLLHLTMKQNLLAQDHLSAVTDPEDEFSETPQKDNIAGLTTAQVEKLYEKWGYNELPTIEVPLWYVFLMQFTGTMPYMLELACVLSLAVQDWVDFAIIFTMILCNGYLGFHEELKAKASLEELTSKMEQKIAVLRDGQAQVLLDVDALIRISSSRLFTYNCIAAPFDPPACTW